MAKITLDNQDQLVHLYLVDKLARELMAEHGLAEWSLVWDRSKSRGGQCRYALKEIGLSAYLMANWGLDHCENIILHEIAHALCPGHGHDKVWRAKFIAIGGNGKRCWGADGETRIQGRWIGRCPNGHEIRRQRKSKVMSQRRSCARCTPVFDARYLIKWEQV